MDPFLSDRHARWHPVDLSLFPLRLSIITRSLTLARLTQTTPVRTVVQGWTTPPARPGLFWLLDARNSSP